MNIKKFRWLMIVSLIIVVSFLMFWIFRNKSITEDQQFGLKEIKFVVEVDQADPIIEKHLTLGSPLISQDTVQKAVLASYVFQENTLKVSIDASAHYRGPFMTIGGQVIKIGKDYYVKTETLELKGRIVAIEYGGSDD